MVTKLLAREIRKQGELKRQPHHNRKPPTPNTQTMIEFALLPRHCQRGEAPYQWAAVTVGDTMNLSTQLTILVGLATLGGFVWTAAEAKRDYDEALADLAGRVDIVEATSPEADGSSILRRLSALEGTVNSLGEDTAIHIADFNRSNFDSTGMGSDLSERLARLEQATGNETSGQVDLSDIEARLTALERRMSAGAAGNTNSPTSFGDISLTPEYTANLPMISSGDFTMQLRGCLRNGGAIRCAFITRNDGSRSGTYNIRLEHSLIYLPDGAQLHATRGYSSGDAFNGDWHRSNVPIGVPFQIELEWNSVPQNVQGFQVMTIYFEGNTRELRGVPIQG